MKKSFFVALTLLCFSITAFAQKQYDLVSPNGKLKIEISAGNQLTYSVSHNGDLLLEKSPSVNMRNQRNFSFSGK